MVTLFNELAGDNPRSDNFGRHDFFGLFVPCCFIPNKLLFEILLAAMISHLYRLAAFLIIFRRLSGVNVSWKSGIFVNCSNHNRMVGSLPINKACKHRKLLLLEFLKGNQVDVALHVATSLHCLDNVGVFGVARHGASLTFIDYLFPCIYLI